MTRKPTKRSTTFERASAITRTQAAALIREQSGWVGLQTAEHLSNLILNMPLPKAPAKESE